MSNCIDTSKLTKDIWKMVKTQRFISIRRFRVIQSRPLMGLWILMMIEQLLKVTGKGSVGLGQKFSIHGVLTIHERDYSCAGGVRSSNTVPTNSLLLGFPHCSWVPVDLRAYPPSGNTPGCSVGQAVYHRPNIWW